jgi:hypothetical protein
MGAEVILQPFEKDQMKDGLINSFLEMLNLNGLNVNDSEYRYNQKLHPDIIYLLLQRKNLSSKLIGSKYYQLIKILSKYKYNNIKNVTSFFSPMQRLILLNEMRPQYEYVAKKFLKRSDYQLFYRNEPNICEEWTPPFEINPTVAAEILMWLWDEVWENENFKYS